VAAQVAQYVFDHGLARAPKPTDVGQWIKDKAFSPTYRSIG